MSRKEALRIIKEENLRNYNWFNNHPLEPDEVGIKESELGYTVFSTSERAGIMTEVSFETESEALKEFIKRARADKAYRSYL